MNQNIGAFKVATAALAAGALLLALTGCSGANAAATPTQTPTASATNPYGGGFAVDAPKATDVVLTVTGSKTVDFTMGELQKLATEKLSIVEPFVKKQQTFTGVPLKTLLDYAGIVVGDKVNTIALNQYQFADTVANLETNKAVLAVTRDGAAIPMDQGGPIRLVFPSDTKYFSYLDAWNWSLRTIKVTSGK
jgi:hypothetical protein